MHASVNGWRNGWGIRDNLEDYSISPRTHDNVFYYALVQAKIEDFDPIICGLPQIHIFHPPERNYMHQDSEEEKHLKPNTNFDYYSYTHCCDSDIFQTLF